MSRRRVVVALAGLTLLALVGAVAWLLWLRPAADARRLDALRVADADADVDGDALTLRWFGTTAVLLQAGDDALMIDPFFTRPRGLWPLLRNAPIAPDEALIAHWLQRAGIARLHAVLVSHSHYDHAMDAGVVARLTGAVLVGSASTAQIGRGAGLDAPALVVAEAGTALPLGPFTVRFIESRHAGATGGAPTGDITVPLTPPARYLDYRQGGTFSILVEHPGGSVLHHGSAGFVDGALQGRHADTVVLGAALVGDAEAYLRQTVDAVGARRVVLTHWDDFTRGLDEPLRPMPVAVDLRELFDALGRRPLDVRVPRVDQRLAVVAPPRPGAAP